MPAHHVRVFVCVDFCDGIQYLYGPSGSFQTRASGGAYGAYSDCMFIISASPSPSSLASSNVTGVAVVLHIQELYTQPTLDSLTIYDGDIRLSVSSARALAGVLANVSVSVPLAALSGVSVRVPPLIAYSGVMSLRFTSDGLTHLRGFAARYEVGACF